MDYVIYVYADFLSLHNELVGKIYCLQERGSEVYAFEYEPSWLKSRNIMLDPDLSFYAGRQYTNDGKGIFGVFADSCPDRWGRLLMKRREELRARKAEERPGRLMESDYLLGVFDQARMGGLRFKTDPQGDFLSNDQEYSTPPWASLREIEDISISYEKDKTIQEERWLRMLFAPGSSLGGARPKASVLAPDGSLWMAKFPSKHDEVDSGAWEMVVHDLALMCGINVPEAKTERLSKNGTTFLVKRFDRDGQERIHFSSAMTMLRKNDGAGASDGSSYLEIVSFLKANGASPAKDIQELWKRIVFGMAVSNTDDHFRNHGFVLTQEGWVLAPMYDVNPDPYGDYLSLNVDSENSYIDFDLAIMAAPYYGLDKDKAAKLAGDIRRKVSDNWRTLAKKLGISRGEIERMSPAFRG
ncbi:MAG: HipA domain-containing protein [Lachnospiraceae bacterium]|nr:HipA domain-containing protein [Lachnospiraceae bacterium]